MADGAILIWTKAITTAIAAPGETQIVLRDLSDIDQVIVQSVFDWGSGGTTAKVWLQTSFDNGVTWVDVASHAFLLADATKISVLSTDIAPATQAFAPGDGALADNTVINGAIGDRIRAKVITTGTYAATTLSVYASVRKRP